METPLDRQFGAKDLAMVTSYLCWRLSSVVMLANIKQMPVGATGEGQGEAGKRRQWASLDKEEQWLERVTGKNLFRRDSL